MIQPKHTVSWSGKNVAERGDSRVPTRKSRYKVGWDLSVPVENPDLREKMGIMAFPSLS